MKTKTKKTIEKVLIGVLILLIVGGGVFCAKGLLDDYFKYQVTVKNNDSWAEAFHSNETEPDWSTSAAKEDLDAESRDLMEKYTTMRRMNGDYACWLVIQGTEQEFPVCTVPSNDQYYYLTHNFNREYSNSGCLFIDPNSSVDCDNLIIYGHHMYNGTMFGSLYNFLDEDWAREHHTIEVYTATEHRYYEVVCTFSASMSNMPFTINGHTNLSNYEDCYNFSQAVRNVSWINMEWIKEGKEYVYNPYVLDPGMFHERFLTLITCEYTHDNGRQVVIAREIDRPIWLPEEKG